MTQDQKLALFTGGGLLAFLALGMRDRSSSGGGLTGTVTTWEGFDLGPYGGATSYSLEIQHAAQAIARQEGFYVTGSVPQRANNPGDLKMPGLPTLPGTSITKFPSADLGWNALHKQLFLIVTGQSSFYNLDMTLEQMAKIWTATQQIPWAVNVANYLGVSIETPLWEVLT
jgi:hypothetical protein